MRLICRRLAKELDLKDQTVVLPHDVTKSIAKRVTQQDKNFSVALGQKSFDVAQVIKVGINAVNIASLRKVTHLVIDAFRASGLEPPRATVYAEAINMRTRLAATGPFLAIVPASMLRFYTKDASIKLLPVELPMTQRSIGIITIKNRTLSPLARLFTECAREIAKPFAKGQALGGRAKNISARNSQTT